MKNKYSFLKDNLALIEIRKHQWIESEKQKTEIGFATAAVDWVKKYGHTWKLARIGLEEKNDILLERRRYRRFQRALPLDISSQGTTIKTQTHDISLVGVSCQTCISLEELHDPEICIYFDDKNPRARIRLKAQVLRCTEEKSSRNGRTYHNVLVLNESSRDFLREHRDALICESN